MNKIIKRWKIVPVKEGKICLIGYVDDVYTQTSNIVNVREGEVRTESGSIYTLTQSEMDISLWELQLQIKRPVQYGILKQNKVL